MAEQPHRKRNQHAAEFFLPRKKHSTNMQQTNNLGDTSNRYKIFCDLDGVLCDFAGGVRKIFGKEPDDLPNVGIMWSGISRSPAFYENLSWTSDGEELWKAILPFNPDILTGVPMQRSSRQEKANWCIKNLKTQTNWNDMAGPKRQHSSEHGYRRKGVVNVITCWSANKHCESGHSCILIDDRIGLKKNWENEGGIFIHHTSTKKSLDMLKELGILFKQEDEKQKEKETPEKSQKVREVICIESDDDSNTSKTVF